jgi:hypothetical protein
MKTSLLNLCGSYLRRSFSDTQLLNYTDYLLDMICSVPSSDMIILNGFKFNLEKNLSLVPLRLGCSYIDCCYGFLDDC